MGNIFLIGFMGTGKSTIAKELNRKYGMTVIDIDEEIVKREGCAIPEIFAQKGEEYFRQVETAVIKELEAVDNTVVSCGGGAVLRPENVESMKRSGRVVLLSATPETILKRVKHDHNRPLLEGKKNVEAIAELIKARADKYNAAADFVVTVDDKIIEVVADEVYAVCK